MTTKSNDYINSIHTRMSRVAKREQMLIEALGEALTYADRRLLDDVRSVTIEHETRRAAILTELQELAARIGAFPATADPIDSLEYEAFDLPPYTPVEEPKKAEQTSDGGDWRQALENISSKPDCESSTEEHHNGSSSDG